MNRSDWRLSSRVSIDSARRVVAKATLALGIVYLAFVVSYLFQLGSEGAGVLAALTGGSSALLIGAAALGWKRDVSASESLGWFVGLAVIVLVNVNVALLVSGDFIFAISHLFVQLAAAVLAPSAGLMLGFVVVNFASCVVVMRIGEIEAPLDLGVLGFLMTTAVAGLIFIARFRNIATMGRLRQTIEDNRDRDFREIIENNPDAVILLRDGEIAYASAPLATYLQVETTAELVGRRLEALVVEGSETLTELLEGRRREPSSVVTLVRRDGEHVLVDIAQPKSITFEDAPAVMLVARDVTASQEALNARLLLADRMSAAGTLAAGVAHEINNPLTYVSMNLSELERLVGEKTSCAADEQCGELIREIQDGVNRVAVIVQDLNAVARISDVEARSTDPIHALRTAVKMVDNQLRHRTELICDLKPLPRITANDGKLVQVFLNILINATHAIDCADSEANTLEITTRSHNGMAIIEVTDSGCGMSDETQRRVFDPFFTTKPPGSGTGLGMFFCHEVVHAVGGRIEIESKVGVGTSVRVLLPASERHTGKLTPLATIERLPVAAKASLSILVVDDEPFVGKAIGRVLSGYQVTVTCCGEDAIREFSKHQHDLVLCDIMMPGISGLQVYERLLEIDPEVEQRVMFMTGGAFTPKARAFAAARDDRILKKPVAVEVLLDLADLVAQKKKAQAST